MVDSVLVEFAITSNGRLIWKIYDAECSGGPLDLRSL